MEMTTLGELISLQRGYDLTETHRRSGLVPIVGSAGVHGYHDTAKAKGPGVTLGRSGASFGKVTFIREDFWPHNTTIFVTDFKGNEPLFIRYLLESLDFSSLNSGSAQQSLNRNFVYPVAVRKFALPVQRRIAGILSAYDELMENSQRRIRILEEMARTLYHEWFVHFRFPGHEQVPFVDSPLGPLPKGWEVSEFRNLFQIKYGKTLPKTDIKKVGLYPVYGAGDVIGYYDEVLCPGKCALVTSRGNGSGTVWRTRKAAFVTNNSLMILPNEQFRYWDYSFVELLLKHSNVLEAKTGSAQPQVTIENLNYVKANVPTRKVVESFCAFATPIYEQVDLLFEKSENLRRTRDLLLPRLFSGQLNLN